MRIAHIITRMIVGGAQENTLLCCQDLIQKHGDDVVLVTGPSLGPEGDLLADGRAGGVPVTRIDSLRREIHPGRDWTAYREILRVLRDFRPEVVHTHSAKGGILGRMAATSLGVPAVIHTVHGSPFHDYQPALAREFFRRCERYAAGKCHVMVSVADAMTDLLVRTGVAPREKFVTVYSGMDVEPFLQADSHREKTRAQFGFGPDEVVFGKIARLFHLKGHEYLIEAARSVVSRCPQVRFLLVGDGILRDSLQQRIRRAGLDEYFRFAGLVAPERIPALIGGMDVLVHASLREGLARALPQALIAGKPVVSYDIDGAREVVLDGRTGYLVPPRGVDTLADAMRKLAENGSQRREFGERGQSLFTEQFRHENMTAQLRAIYGKVLSGQAL